jgi:hypothetical protein
MAEAALAPPVEKRLAVPTRDFLAAHGIAERRPGPVAQAIADLYSRPAMEVVAAGSVWEPFKPRPLALQAGEVIEGSAVPVPAEIAAPDWPAWLHERARESRASRSVAAQPVPGVSRTRMGATVACWRDRRERLRVHGGTWDNGWTTPERGPVWPWIVFAAGAAGVVVVLHVVLPVAR